VAKPSGPAFTRDRVSDIHITGKFRDEKYGKTLGEKKIKIVEMAVAAGQPRQGSSWRMWNSTRKTPAAPIRPTSSK